MNIYALSPESDIRFQYNFFQLVDLGIISYAVSITAMKEVGNWRIITNYDSTIFINQGQYDYLVQEINKLKSRVDELEG